MTQMALITGGSETKSVVRKDSPYCERLFRPAIDHDYSENYLPWGRVAKPPL